MTTTTRKTATTKAAAPKAATTKTAAATSKAADSVKETVAATGEKTVAVANEAVAAANRNVTKAAETVKQNATVATEKAREIVQRGAVEGKKQTETAYEGVTKFNSAFEKSMSRLVTGYVGILGDVAEATHANMIQGFGALEQVSQAKTPAEAAQIQADFIRDTANANMERARNAAASTRDIMTESIESLRDSLAGMYKFDKKSA